MRNEGNVNLKASSRKRKVFRRAKGNNNEKRERKKETERDKDDGWKGAKEKPYTNRIFKSFKIVSMFMLNEEL